MRYFEFLAKIAIGFALFWIIALLRKNPKPLVFKGASLILWFLLIYGLGEIAVRIIGIFH